MSPEAMLDGQFRDDAEITGNTRTVEMLAALVDEARAQQVADDEGLRLHVLFAAIRGSVAQIARRSSVRPSNVDISTALAILLGQIIAGVPLEKRAPALNEAVHRILKIGGTTQ